MNKFAKLWDDEFTAQDVLLRMLQAMTDEMRLLREATDELREEIQWANRNSRDFRPETDRKDV
jgi:hypothetical protein